jgi:hypothetical protein
MLWIHYWAEMAQVRDISTMVKPSQLIDSENLTTLFVIVSKFGLQEWEATYEKLSNFVVGMGQLQDVCNGKQVMTVMGIV